MAIANAYNSVGQGAFTRDAIREARSRGVDVRVELALNADATHVAARNLETNRTYNKMIGGVHFLLSRRSEDEILADAVRECVDQVSEDYREIDNKFLREELAKYKAAVKDLSFRLEMAQTSNAVLRAGEVRRLALEEAAEYLMDYGAVKTGRDLESVCEQIKALASKPPKVVPHEQ